jgi:hypothetical protein
VYYIVNVILNWVLLNIFITIICAQYLIETETMETHFDELLSGHGFKTGPSLGLCGRPDAGCRQLMISRAVDAFNVLLRELQVCHYITQPLVELY